MYGQVPWFAAAAAPAFSDAPSFGATVLAPPASGSGEGKTGDGNLDRPSDENPLAVVSWALETKQTASIVVRSPMLHFELQQFAFVPQPQSAKAPVSLPVVSLTLFFCSISDPAAPSSASRAAAVGEGGSQAGFLLGVERRLALLRHVIETVLRLKRHVAVFVHRANDELLHPASEPAYKALVSELERVQSRIRPVFVEPLQRSLHITFLGNPAADGVHPSNGTDTVSPQEHDHESKRDAGSRAPRRAAR